MTSATDVGTPRRRRWPVLTLVVVVVLLVAWGLAVGTAALSARASMRAAETELQQARDDVRDFDIEAADARLAEASDQLARAQARLERPDVRLAARLPWIGDDLRTATAVARGADLVATGGRGVTRAILDLPDGAGSLLPRDGALPADALAELVRPVEEASARILEARGLVLASPASELTGQVADARADFLTLVDPVADSLDELTALARSLPGLLGADEPRRYFLGAANPAEQRGTGGFLGSYTIATFDDGRLSIGTFGDINDLPDVADELPESHLAPWYDAFGGGGSWKNLNMTPDMPSAAGAIEALWAEVHGEELDGTIVVDPFALAGLVELSGPVALPDGSELTSDEVVDYLTNEAYVEYFGAGEERKGILGDVAEAALLGFLSEASEESAQASLEVLAELVAEGHLLVHSRHEDIQEGLRAVGADGALPDPPGDLVAVVVNSAANAKVDFYTERTVDYEVDLLADGAARGVLTVGFRNEAPAGDRSHVLGPNVDGLDVGDNRFLLSTYCASSCELESADPGLYGTVLEEELDHPVATTWVEVPRGGSESLRYAWRVPDAWEDTEGRLVYHLTIRHQVTVPPTDVRVAVAIPEGFTPDGPLRGWELVGDELVYDDRTHGGESSLEVRLRPSG